MVYCGKPSRGCQMCRTRRIKCDETKPTCNQCAKSRRQCPGYKDDFDLVFRNETQATERRARRAVNSKRVHAQLNFKTSQSTIAPTSLETDDDMFRAAVKPSTSDLMQLLAPASSVSISVDQQAPCYFMSNFVMSTEHSSRGYFDFLVPMLKTEAPDSHLSLAFSAVAMAGLANRPNTRGRALFPAAVAQYTKALRSINIALQDPTKQKTDQTLAAILLLGFFETICSEKSNAMAWYSHMDGAVQLVKMRGRKQLRTKVGYALFASVRAQMSVSCLSGSKAPALGSEWWIADIAKDEKTAFLTKLSLRVAELRVEINDALTSYSRTPEYFQEVLNFMRRAQAMEQEYLDWEAAMPESWKPRTVAWVDQVPGGDISKAAICPGKVDMYDDIWVGHVWNSGRITRMYISGIIVRCAAWVSSPVDYRTTPEYAQAVRLCVDLITDIIASIPFHLGWRVGPNGVLKHPDMSSFQGADDDVEFPKALGGFFCMWPLFSISNTDYITDSQRLWTKGRLMYISEILGLNHAKVLSNFQLRLPSMIIRRDTLMHTPLSAPLTGSGSIPTFMNRNFPSPPMSGNPMISHSLSANPQGVQAPAALLNDMPDHQASFTPPNSAGYMPTSNSVAQTRQFGQQYALNPLQQREAMQKETWEKERKSLLKKASNQQGDSVERLLANYLAV